MYGIFYTTWVGGIKSIKMYVCVCVIENSFIGQLLKTIKTMKEITFEDKVYKKLVELEPAEYGMVDRFMAAINEVDLPERVPYDLLKKVSEAVREHFIKTVKDFIRYDYGKAWGFYIEFNDSYTNIIKKEY